MLDKYLYFFASLKIGKGDFYQKGYCLLFYFIGCAVRI